MTITAPGSTARRPHPTSIPHDESSKASPSVTSPIAISAVRTASNPESTMGSTRSRKGGTTPPRAGKPGEVRRIVALFSEHKGRLLLVAALIIASSLISATSSMSRCRPGTPRRPRCWPVGWC
jgi:hypothetical protein